MGDTTIADSTEKIDPPASSVSEPAPIDVGRIHASIMCASEAELLLCHFQMMPAMNRIGIAHLTIVQSSDGGGSLSSSVRSITVPTCCLMPGTCAAPTTATTFFLPAPASVSL